MDVEAREPMQDEELDQVTAGSLDYILEGADRPEDGDRTPS